MLPLHPKFDPQKSSEFFLNELNWVWKIHLDLEYLCINKTTIRTNKWLYSCTHTHKHTHSHALLLTGWNSLICMSNRNEMWTRVRTNETARRKRKSEMKRFLMRHSIVDCCMYAICDCSAIFLAQLTFLMHSYFINSMHVCVWARACMFVYGRLFISVKSIAFCCLCM